MHNYAGATGMHKSLLGGDHCIHQFRDANDKIYFKLRWDGSQVCHAPCGRGAPHVNILTVPFEAWKHGKRMVFCLRVEYWVPVPFAES